MRLAKLLFFPYIFFGCYAAHAQYSSPPQCARQYFASLKASGPTLGITNSQAEVLLQEVSQSISFPNNIRIAYCGDYIEKIQAWPAKNIAEVPDGDYILVNQDWLREVLGNDRTQAIALFGHEIGHFSGRHFESRESISRVQKETEADRAAGCAVGRLSGDLPRLEDLLSRLRTVSGGNGYPRQEVSLAAARDGFRNCNASPRPIEYRTRPEASFECKVWDCTKP